MLLLQPSLGRWHWQWRVVDRLGLAGPWTLFGGFQLESGGSEGAASGCSAAAGVSFLPFLLMLFGALSAFAQSGPREWSDAPCPGYRSVGAIAATDDSEANIGVYDDAERRAMLVNVVDVPPLCNFILPAIMRSGPLAIAISTAGASPALAKRMKREVAELFGEEYARLAVILNEARGWAKATLPTYQDRKEFFEGIVNGDPDPVALLRDDRETQVLALVEAAKERAAAALA